MHIISSYHNNEFMNTDVEVAEEYTALMGILEIYIFVKENFESSLEPTTLAILELFLKHFSRSSYVLEYYNNLVSIKERSNGLQEYEEKDGEEKV